MKHGFASEGWFANAKAIEYVLKKMERPITIDLFCGAGGITEGFRQAGFHCIFANDFNANAIDTFQYNHPSIKAVCAPIEKLSPKTIRRELGIERGELDVLVGGPPCHGFSINKALNP